MDQIYTHDTELKKAKLVTILASYANDYSFVQYTEYNSQTGEYETKTGLPIGEKTDYYPYDEEGYHPTGLAGVNTMINKGATWFGCLNWCIKWLSENYPRAQIILMFGNFSGNSGEATATSRKIVKRSTGTEGVEEPPYYLDFSEPSSSTSMTVIDEQLRELVDLYNIDLIDLYTDGLPMTYWAARAMEDGKYVLFSTTGTAQNPTFNNHPSNDGYLMLARYMAGKVLSLYYR